MKIRVFSFLCASLCLLLGAVPSTHAQTASTVISGTTITTVVTDVTGNIYTVRTPYTLSIEPGSTELSIQAAPPPPPPPPPAKPVAPAIPDTALISDLINPKGATWKACEHDAGTPGTGKCANNYPVTSLASDSARAFAMTYTGAGGVRWAISFAKDTKATNFVLDTNVQSPDWTHAANLELDTNQVKANGKTDILGTQCSSYSKTWEVTLINPATKKWHWVPTNVTCNTKTWAPNVVHHIRIFGSISDSDVSTYTGVEFDGDYAAFSGATGPTGVDLGWSIGTVLTNVQIDGLGQSGAATVYADKLTIYRW